MFYLFLAILPIYIIGNYFYHKDTIKEPKRLLKKLFLSGIFSGIIVIIISLILYFLFPNFSDTESLNLWELFIYTFIFISLVEESCKFLMIYKISYHNNEFDQLFDIILYSVFVGLGFACFENILYVFQSESLIFTAIFRSITAIPAHVSFQTIMGYFLGKAKFKGNFKKNSILSIVIPIILHGLYDFLLLTNNILLIIIFFIFIIILFIYVIIKVKKIIAYDKRMLNNDLCPNCNIKIVQNYCPNCGIKK